MQIDFYNSRINLETTASQILSSTDSINTRRRSLKPFTNSFVYCICTDPPMRTACVRAYFPHRVPLSCRLFIALRFRFCSLQDSGSGMFGDHYVCGMKPSAAFLINSICRARAMSLMSLLFKFIFHRHL